LGEDPGLTDHLSGTAGLVITLLWLVAAAGWAVWRALSPQAGWRGSGVDLALVATVIVVLVSAIGAASYKDPAWLIASEWLVLVVAFCLVRQLAITPADNHCLLAVLLATGVSLSLQGIYQYFVEFPGQIREAEKPELIQALAQTGIYLNPESPTLEHLRQRLQADNIFVTYVNPNSFAGFLALLFPLALGWALAAKLGQRWTLRIALAFGCAAVMAIALWLTHSRGAILATILVGTAIGIFYWRRFLWKHKWICLIAAIVLVGMVYLPFVQGWVTTSGLEKTQASMNKRLDYWSATWQMIKDHPWLGVGPGQFGRFYPRYMRETAYEKISNPHNFLLEMWATCGVFALATLAAAFAVFFWQARSAWALKDSMTTNDEVPPTIRWEYYLGGTAGLMLGFVLWTRDLTGDNLADLLTYGFFIALLRFLFWLGCFALFESIVWRGPTRAIALTAGVAAMLLNLLVSDGISLPSVAQPLWIVAALALNALALPAITFPTRNWLSIAVPIPLLGTVCLAYFVFLFDPTYESGRFMREARLLYPLYQAKSDELRNARSGTDRQKAESEVEYIRGRITKDLEVASFGDSRQRQKPFRSEPLVHLARIYGDEWMYGVESKYSPVRGEALIQIRRRAANCAEMAIDLDPEGLEGYRSKFELNMMFAQGSTTETRKFYELAFDAMLVLVHKDPTEAGNHFHLAEMLFQLGEQETMKKEAKEGLRLDNLSTDPARKLRDSQRWRMMARLDPDNVSIRYQLTQALYLEGDKNETKREAEKTLELNQKSADPKRALTESQRRNLDAWLHPPSSH
jgi:O-antigen ligase